MESILGLSRDVCFTREPTFTEDDYPDLTNQNWVVSGATSGIGYEVAVRLLKKGAKLWLIARSEEKTKETIAKLKEVCPSGQIDYCLVDYSDLTTFGPGLERLKSIEILIHGVIHNAGVMMIPRGTVSKQNIEYHLAVNCLGTQMLQRHLDPLLLRTSQDKEARIVWVSSAAQYMSPSDFDNLEKRDGFPIQNYGFSKAVNYIQAVQWAKNHPDANVVSIAVHPGVIETNLYQHTNWFLTYLGSFIWKPAKYGAYTELYGALSPDLKPKEVGKRYVVPFGVLGEPYSVVYKAANDERGDKIWAWLNEQVDKYFVTPS